MHVLSFSLVGLVFPYVSLSFWPLLFLLRFFRLLIPFQTQQFLLAIVNINFPDGGEKSICSFKKKTRPMPLSSNWLATLCRSLTERANLSIWLQLAYLLLANTLMLHGALFDLILLQFVFS